MHAFTCRDNYNRQVIDDDGRLINNVRMPYERRLGVIDIRQMPFDNLQSTYRDYELPFALVCLTVLLFVTTHYIFPLLQDIFWTN